MISTCSEQQITDWHYRTVCRYELAAMPATIGLTNILKNITNKVKANKFLAQRSLLNKGPLLHALAEQFLKVRTKRREIQAPRDDAIVLASAASLKGRAYANHVKCWKHITKVSLHITSGKLLSNIELYPSFYTAFCCFGNQAPQIVKSKQAVAEFNVIKGAIIGARSNLQKQNKFYFLYKWAFIAAGNPQIKSTSSGQVQCLGVCNVFIFPELDKYNYYLFEPIGGVDLTFNVQKPNPVTVIK